MRTFVTPGIAGIGGRVAGGAGAGAGVGVGVGVDWATWTGARLGGSKSGAVSPSPSDRRYLPNRCGPLEWTAIT